ncbi:MAG: hypothetical protein LBQ09_10900 [Acidobacteriaceae bacterium]|jgi:hypothetical protein|nr:hypothetical protein [Acidobacteriaceae bacterium]
MFLGHLAVGLAAKKATPRVSLAMLLLAAQWADTLWPVLLLAGIEHVRIDPGNTVFTPLAFVDYPYSHSLVALLGWAVVIGGLYRGIVGGRRTMLVLGVLVLSHWGLDFVTHRPDMPLYPGGPLYGLGLWNSVPATIGIELAMFAIGLFVYLSTTRARDRIGRWGFAGLVVVLVGAYIANISSAPPPSVTVLAVAAIAGAGVMTLWAWWVDRHRDVVS